MKLLLDTHIAIWAILDHPRLGSEARELLEAPDSEPIISVVTIWEASIKHALGDKRPDPIPLSGKQARKAFEDEGHVLLTVTAEHAAAMDDLPLHHGDPFDRLLIAQAMSERMRLITRDKRLAQYGSFVELV